MIIQLEKGVNGEVRQAVENELHGWPLQYRGGRKHPSNDRFPEKKQYENNAWWSV